MASFNKQGKVLMGASGGGQNVLSVDGVAVPGNLVVSVPRWVDDYRCLASINDIAHLIDVRDGSAVSLGHRSNFAAGSGAGNSVWAYASPTNPWTYRDGFGNTFISPRYKPVGANDEGVLVIDYDKDGDLYLVKGPNNVELLLSGPIPRGDVSGAGFGGWAARTKETEVCVSTPGTGKVMYTIPASADLAFDYPYLVTWAHEKGLIIINVLTQQYKTITTTECFYPAVMWAPAGAHVAASATTGERPQNLMKWFISVTEAGWQDLNQSPSPLPPATPPFTLTLPPPPLPHPIWIAPFQVITDRWGDDPDPAGNAMVVTIEDPKEDPMVSRARVIRAGDWGLPLFVDRGSFHPEVASLVVGVFLSAPTEDIMADEIYVTTNLITTSSLPDVPLVCYIDAPDYFLHNPDWSIYDQETHWLAPQFYREPSESELAFRNRCMKTLKVCGERGFYVLPVWCAYDRNGRISKAELVEIQDMLWDDLPDSPHFIGVLPFSDMRRGTIDGVPIGGMSLYPEVKDAIHLLTRLNPEDRPHRWSYWNPRFQSTRDVIMNKLLQDRTLIHLTEEEKEWLEGELGRR